MSVSRKDLIRYLEQNGYFCKREGGNHSIYSNGNGKMIPVKRHSTFDRIVANEISNKPA